MSEVFGGFAPPPICGVLDVASNGLPDAPTFWPGSAWDTHLLFNDDLSSHVGVNDNALVPNGYTGPPFSYAPLDGTLLLVAFPPAPQVSADGFTR